MCSSRIDRELGCVVVTTPGPSTPVGMRFWPAGTYQTSRASQFEDYLARLALSRSSNGHAWGEGVAVRAPDGALLEEIANGCVHPSLVAEPNGNGTRRVAGVGDAPVVLSHLAG